jgi:hypothetical protein
LNNSQISSRDRHDQSPLIMSCPFYLTFLMVVHHVTLWLFRSPSLYDSSFYPGVLCIPFRPWVFPDVGVSSFGLMGMRGILPWKTLWASMIITSHWQTLTQNNIPPKYCS